MSELSSGQEVDMNIDSNTAKKLSKETPSKGGHTNNARRALRHDDLKLRSLDAKISDHSLSKSKRNSLSHRKSYYLGHKRLMSKLISRSTHMSSQPEYVGTEMVGTKTKPDHDAAHYTRRYEKAWSKTHDPHAAYHKSMTKTLRGPSQHKKDVKSADHRFGDGEGSEDIHADDGMRITELKEKHPHSSSAQARINNKIRYLEFERKHMNKYTKAGYKYNEKKYGSKGGGIQAYENGDNAKPSQDARKHIPAIMDAYRRKYHLGKYAKSNQKSDDNSKDKSAKESVHDDKSTGKKPQDRKRKAMQSNVAKNGKQASAGSNTSNNGNSQSAKSASSQASVAKSQSSKSSSAQSSQAKSQSSATKSRASSQSSMAKSQSSKASSAQSSHSAARSASRSQSTASKAQVSASQKATSASKASASKLAKSNHPASSQAKQSAKPNNKNVSQSASHEDSNKQSAKSKSQASMKSKPTSQKSSASQIHKNSSAKPAARKASPAQKREKKAAKNPYISKPSAVHHYKKAAVAGATGAGAVRARKLHNIKHYRGELANKRDYGRGHFKTQGAYQSYVKKNASHYAVSPKSGQIVPKNLTQHQQSGIRRKMLADQRSLGLGQNRPQTQQPAPETHTNPFVNKGTAATAQPSNNGASAQHSNPFVNKSVQQQAPSGQTNQNQPQDQQNSAMQQFDANHPLAGRFIQRMQQDFGEGNGVDNQVQQAQQDAGMQNQNNSVSQFGQRAAQAGHTAAQTAQNVGHQAVQQPAAHALGQQATQAATGLSQNRPQASQNPGLANALQRGLNQDRNNVAAQNAPQSNPQVGQGMGAIHTPNTQQQSAPQTQQSTPQQPSQQPSVASQAPVQSSNQTAQLGGNNLIHSQIAQSQTAAQQQPSGPQQGGSQQSGPQV